MNQISGGEQLAQSQVLIYYNVILDICSHYNGRLPQYKHISNVKTTMVNLFVNIISLYFIIVIKSRMSSYDSNMPGMQKHFKFLYCTKDT